LTHLIIRFLVIRGDRTEVLHVPNLALIHVLLPVRHSYFGKLKKLVLLDLNHLKVLSLFALLHLCTEIEPYPNLLRFNLLILLKSISDRLLREDSFDIVRYIGAPVARELVSSTTSEWLVRSFLHFEFNFQLITCK
jgi:hypothetical protein